jgi:hypothetical protein
LKTKGAAILLIAAWVMYLVLPSIVWNVTRRAAQSESACFFGRLTSILVKNPKTLTWERAGKEFWHDGHLYDLVYSEKTDGGYVFHCRQDDKETNAYACFGKSVKKQSDDIIKKWPALTAVVPINMIWKFAVGATRFVGPVQSLIAYSQIPDFPPPETII